MSFEPMSFGLSVAAVLKRWVVPLVLALSSSAAPAAVLVPGQGKTPIEEIPFQFEVVDFQTQPFFIGGQAAGTVVDRVLRVNGSLAFETRILPLAGVSINQVQRTNYTGFATDARPEPDTVGDFSPDFAERLIASTVQFDFSSPVLGGANGSNFFVILTDATSYKKVGVLSAGLDGAFSSPVSVFSPVPEPGEWLCMLAGLSALVLVSHARRRRPQSVQS